MAKVLIVEDHEEIGQQVKTWLEREGYHCDHVLTGRQAQDYLAVSAYDAIILDWDLPELSGIDLLTAMRAKSDTTPVLMMTGKSGIADLERGFNCGADDYLVKPIQLRELTVRLTALRRRRDIPNYDTVLKTRSIELDTRAKRVKKCGSEVALQPQELAVLTFLLENSGQIFDAEALMARVWPSDSMITREGVRVCITRIRTKLDTEDQESIIRTVRKSGYQINLDA